jgi:hypothetical protein
LCDKPKYFVCLKQQKSSKKDTEKIGRKQIQQVQKWSQKKESEERERKERKTVTV